MYDKGEDGMMRPTTCAVNAAFEIPFYRQRKGRRKRLGLLRGEVLRKFHGQDDVG